MARAVHERVAPSRRDDHVAARGVDRRAVGARAHRVAPRPLALAHDVPDPPGVGPGIADAHRAGHVGAVAVDDAAEVDHDELAPLDDPRARAGVRLGRVRARWRRSGRSCCRSRPAGASRPRGRARSRVRCGRRSVGRSAPKRVVGDRARGVDARDLAGLLDPAQPFDEALGRRRARARRTTAANVRCCDQLTAWASRPTRAPGSSAPSNASRCSATVAPISIVGVDAERAELLARLGAVAPVGGEHRGVAR